MMYCNCVPGIFLMMELIHSILEAEIGLKNLLAGSSINFVNKVAATKELEISKGIAGQAGNGTSGCFPTTVNPMERIRVLVRLVDQ